MVLKPEHASELTTPRGLVKMQIVRSHPQSFWVRSGLGPERLHFLHVLDDDDDDDIARNAILRTWLWMKALHAELLRMENMFFPVWNCETQASSEVPPGFPK